MKTVQYFTDKYLLECRAIKPEQIIEFLENFKTLHSKSEPHLKFGKSVLISLKVPEKILTTFRQQALREGIPYQTQIKKLMLEWLRY